MAKFEVGEKLKDPRVSLPAYGTVLGQEESQIMKYDPFSITDRLQWDILSYVGEQSRTVDGHLEWVIVVAYRQGGKSTVSDLALYPRTMYTDGLYHVTIADEMRRATYLHTRLQINHMHWPTKLRVEQRVSNESRKLEFVHGGGMHVLAGGSNAVGVGYSPDSIHLSEVPLHGDARGTWNLLMPAVINRKEAIVIMESTPYPMSYPSTEFYRNMYHDAKQGGGRFKAMFYPFWDGKLNVRSWPDDWTTTNEEIKLLERYGHLGLSLENLAFRRNIMDNDEEIRRNPELFDVFYPSNDIDCWLISGSGIIPERAIERQSKFLSAPIETSGEKKPHFVRFKQPDPNAVYAMGVDPAGYGKDHHAFQILEVWEDGWEQVASFGAEIDPMAFGDIVMREAKHYNMAKIAVESNGVGQGLITRLLLQHYPNIYYGKAYKPGVHHHAHDKMLEIMIDSLLDDLVLRDEDTLTQCQTYKGDMVVEQSQASAILHPGSPGRKRRPRHHWDKVSALGISCIVARSLPRIKKPAPIETRIKLSNEMSYNDWDKYRRELASLSRRKR